MSSDTQSIFDAAVDALERDGGIKNSADSQLLQGRWKLLFTSRPGTASPIQNSFTGVDAFTVYQEILVDSKTSSVRVNNIVDFGAKVGFLKVEAEGSTVQRPIPGFTPRQGSGLPFGILGVSTSTPPAYPGLRVDFQFDRAAFYFRTLPFTVPYPVPFKLLGDERKGWLDITYLSRDGTFRLARGNKGTLFVLTKDDTVPQRLINAITTASNTKGSSHQMKQGPGDEQGVSDADGEIEALLSQLIQQQGSDGISKPARSKKATGSWRLLWTKQGKTANALQKTLTGVVKNWQIISEDGSKLENRVELLPGIRVRALAESEVQSATRTRVVITDVVLQVGPFKVDIPITRDADGYVDWLYLDDGLRVTKGNKGSLFVHVRDDSAKEEWEG